MSRALAVSRLFLVAIAALGLAPSAHAQKEAAAPVDNYICPNAVSPRAVDCFLNAVDHLYTMCRHVKSIEVIEFGYEKSEDDTNGAKSSYCIDKQKLSMTRPYQAALKEATGVRAAIDQLKALYEQWQKSLQGLKWRKGESGNDYESRTVLAYVMFSEHAAGVHVALNDAAAAKAAPKAAAPKAATKSAASAKAPAKASAPPAKKSAN